MRKIFYSLILTISYITAYSQPASLNIYANGAKPLGQLKDSAYKDAVGFSVEFITGPVFKHKRNVYEIRLGLGFEQFYHGKSNEISSFTGDTKTSSVQLFNRMNAFYIAPKFIFNTGQVRPYFDVFWASRRFYTLRESFSNTDGSSIYNSDKIYNTKLSHFGTSVGLLYHPAPLWMFDLRVSYSRGGAINYAELSSLTQEPFSPYTIKHKTVNTTASDMLIFRLGIAFMLEKGKPQSSPSSPVSPVIPEVIDTTFQPDTIQPVKPEYETPAPKEWAALGFYFNSSLAGNRLKDSGYRNGVGFAVEYLSRPLFRTRNTIFEIRLGMGYEHIQYGRSRKTEDVIFDTPGNDKGWVRLKNTMNAFYISPRFIINAGAIRPYAEVLGGMRAFNTFQQNTFYHEVEDYDKSTSDMIIHNRRIWHYGYSAGIMVELSKYVLFDLRVTHSKGSGISFVNLRTVEKDPAFQSNVRYNTVNVAASDIFMVKAGFVIKLQRSSSQPTTADQQYEEPQAPAETPETPKKPAKVKPVPNPPPAPPQH